MTTVLDFQVGAAGFSPLNSDVKMKGFSPGGIKIVRSQGKSIAMLSAQEFRTFFVTSATHGRRSIFKSQKMAALLLEVLQNNRKLNRCLLHEIVLMPDHFHLLITPAYELSLEKVMQFIKGGFSYRVKRELNFKREIWQPGFNEHRIKDSGDYAIYLGYIRNNSGALV